MNELNIYTTFNYKKILKKANIYFTGKYVWYNPKTVFASNDNTYLVSMNRWNIRICYWDEHSTKAAFEKKNIVEFLEECFKGRTVGVTYDGECDILQNLHSVKTRKIG